MSGYTKLFSEIVDSSIWEEDPQTFKVWIALLALANSDGYVRGSTGWLAAKTRIPLKVCAAALEKFKSPDPRSRTAAFDGRRIEQLEDGWLILNYIVFRDRLSSDPQAVATRLRVQKHRQRYNALRNNFSVTEPASASASASVQSRSFGKCENLFFGSVPSDLIDLAPKLMPTAQADEWQDYVQAKIEELGYTVKREVKIVFGSETGRIDLVADKNGTSTAIELDNRTPRQKSIRKVQAYGNGMVLLRDPKMVQVPFDTSSTDATIPSFDEIKEIASTRGIPFPVAKSFFDYYQANNLWLNRHDRPINIGASLTRWASNERQKHYANPKGYTPKNLQKPPPTPGSTPVNGF